MLNYNEDVVGKYELLFEAAYEKANIWPLREKDCGFDILKEEVAEVIEDVRQLEEYIKAKIEYGQLEAKETIAYAVNTMCELLQVIAVCNKYEEVFNNEK